MRPPGGEGASAPGESDGQRLGASRGRLGSPRRRHAPVPPANAVCRARARYLCTSTRGWQPPSRSQGKSCRGGPVSIDMPIYPLARASPLPPLPLAQRRVRRKCRRQRRRTRCKVRCCASARVWARRDGLTNAPALVPHHGRHSQQSRRSGSGHVGAHRELIRPGGEQWHLFVTSRRLVEDGGARRRRHISKDFVACCVGL